MQYLAPLLLVLLAALPTAPVANVSQTIRDDERTGTVVDKQGTALVRPVGRERWSPVRQKTVLMPGDQLRTPVRGANAVEVRLAGGGSLVLGPGSLVELTKRGALRLYRGELEVKAEKNKIGLTGPGGFEGEVAASKTLMVRAKDRKTTTLKEAPRWLSGYRNSTTDEWMGSLIAKVDGRDVPLSVGYHKVDVVIRDQIAQTTVEQSFLNSTRNRLEGIFYFPLPADASISGFGMWIGGELVEADLVEKERAREIYEDILRRKKDPGLLEWSGGNLFKARVFPIEPHSEKRVRIRYTQVLPLEGSLIRYRYALRSELLRSRPLKKLQLKVTVSSSMPITSASSPSHEMRVRHTPDAAVMEFDAEEHSPERDFEAVVELDRSDTLTVVPHRREEDGYFMMLLSPPGQAGGKWQRELMPEGKAMDVLILADTSGSMDTAAREAQSTFVRGLFSLLGPKDTFQLLTLDVGVSEFSDQPQPAAKADKALDFLEARPSLGWTDLDLGMQKVLERLHKNTVVIYVGDGIGTTGDADPVALADRLKRLAKAKNNVFHAVHTGSTYEKVVLETIAGLGGGSVRAVGDDPAQTAYTLLAESAQPAVKDLRVSFEGIRIARVYPEQLPNLPIGTQQVILGRFLPTGKDQSGNVVVTGTLEGKPVRYTARLKIQAHETGNSFTPRLWARRHLDHLLAQGRSAQVKEDIVAFSQEFGIMTPYTSFLVLESDEDRKRYGVERQVSMRDGERFFAEGRDAASTAILRQQMKLARTWRLNLRYQMLQEIASLGRDLHGWSVAVAPPVFTTRLRDEANLGFGRGPIGERAYRSDTGIRGGGEWEGLARSARAPSTAAPVTKMDKTLEAGEVMDEDVEFEEEEAQEVQEEDRFAPAERAANIPPRKPAGRGGRRRVADFDMDDSYGWAGGKKLRRQVEVYPALTFASMGFPSLGRPAKEPLKLDDPKWPADVLAILRGLDRRPALEKIEGGLELVRTQESLHAVQGRATHWSGTRLLYTADSWLSQSEGRGAQPSRSWLLEGKRGVAVLGLKLGRVRDGVERDRRFSLDLSDYSTTDLVQGWRHYHVTRKDLDGGIVQLTFTAPAPQRSRFRLEIDTGKKVVGKSTSYDTDFRVSQTTTYSDFVEVAGTWWSQRIERRNEKNQVFHRQKLTVKAASKDAAVAAMTEAAAAHSQVVFIGAVDPKLADAKQAVHENKAGFAEHMRVALHYAATQQWEKVWANLDRASRAAEGKFAVPFLVAWLRTHSRRGQEFGEGLAALVEAARGAGADTRDFLAAHLRQLGGSVLGTNEQLALLEDLAAIYRTAGRDAEWRDLEYHAEKARLLWNLDNKEEALALRKATATRYPAHMRAVGDYLQTLVSTADLQGAVRYADEVLAAKDRWLESEIDTVFYQWTEGLWRLRRLPDLLRVARRWQDRRPENQQAYVRYASALLFDNQEKSADEWVQRRLDDERTKISRAYQQELGAAIQMALGSGWNFQTNGIEEKWLEPLAKLARRLARTEGNTLHLAQSIVGNWRFRQTDQYRELRNWFLADLMKDGVIAEMSLERLGYYLQWISWHKDHVSNADWQKVTGLIRSRFDASKDKDEQRKLGEHVLMLLDVRQEKKDALAFLRHWREVALEQKDHVTRQLFDRLAREEWTKELQTELFQLVPGLQPEKARDHQRRSIAAGAARLLADQVFKSRVKALLGPVEKLEKLPRAERREKTRVFQAQAQAELAQAFGDALKTTDKWARPWLTLEGLCFAALTKKDLAATATAAKELLASVPKVDPDEDPQEAHMPLILRRRCAVLLAYTASRRATPAGVVDQVLDVYAAGEKADKEQKLLNWRYQTFRLLVALDRTKSLETVLSSWISPGAETAWRKALAYLKAEGGKLKEAVAALEGVESVDELDSRDYENLANWHLVLGDDTRREKAQLNRYQVMDIYQISRRINQEQRRVSSRGGDNVPQTLDPDVLRAQRVLLSKAPRPRDYVWHVNNLYRAVKDFRLLEALPHGVVGHTPEGIYPFLSQVGGILDNIHEEATCDALVAAIRRQATDRTVDQRGLLLLTAMVERRAARVLNAPGGHVARGLAAMTTAFKGSWLPGERTHMASYLYSLGKIRHPGFAHEQLRQLKELYAQAEGSPASKLTLAYHLARTYWLYDRKNEAVSTLEMALADYKRANGGVLRSSANHTVNALVGYMEGSGRYAAAETFLRQQGADQVLQSQKDWYRQRIYQLYSNCLQKGGSISLGKGEALYLAARDEMRGWLWKCGFDQMNATLDQLCGLHRAAHKVHITRSGGDLQTWTKEAMAELATRFVLDQAYRVRTVADTLATVRNHRVALGVLLDHIEREPGWLRRVRREGWSVYSWSIATHRSKAGRLGDLTARLRKVALAELARDLSSMSWRNTSMFYRNNRYFWGAMADEFGNVALECVRKNQDSPSRIMFAADYLWSGLAERDEAVAALVGLDGRGKLPDSGRYRLVVWLQEMRRWRDSLGHLTKLIDKNPDNLDYRVRKVRALFETGQTEEAKSLLAATEKLFRDKKVWHVNVIARLADVAREGRYYDKGAALYEEAIRMFERGGARHWNYRHTLSGYYTQWARCLTALNRMDEAVDAASAAVVAWGRDQNNRRQALAELQRVFRKMGDGVDDYVGRWNQKVAKTGLDAPVIRKMLGLVYMDSRRWPEAIQQLQIARELQPNDAEVHANLVKCFDRKGDGAGASHALLTSIAMSPMNLSLYTDLGRRLERAGDKVAAERAYTTMVEVKPNEAESHRLLGQLREQQRRYPDAVVQWQQVVRIRSREPDGWLSLGHAQVKAGQLDAARKTVDHLLKTEWDKRFENVDAQARQLAQLVERSG